MRPRTLVVAAALGALLTIAGAAFALDDELPGILPADDQRPAALPSEGQQVLVAEVLLFADGEQVRAELRSLEVVDSFAPKVVARSGGTWEIRLLGGKELTYQIPNPLADIEAERPDDEKQPFETVTTDTYEWTLIAPLYRDGEPLGASRVQVVDLEAGQTILEADFRD